MPPKRKQEIVRERGGITQEVAQSLERLVVTDEMAAMWKAIYELAKQNTQMLTQLPELKENDRSNAKLNVKLDQVFKPLMKK